jgi:hypothetical protein
MNSERPIADTQSQSPTINQPVVLQSECYLAASPTTDVLYDQLEYLLAHTAERANLGHQCAPECMDCGRLQQVKNWLLLPFHSAMHRPVQ